MNKINIPSSKSYIQRALICASMSRGECFISCNNFCDDVLATANCLNALGNNIDKRNNGFFVKEFNFTERKIQREFDKSKLPLIDVGSSGATLRFILPLIGVIGKECKSEMSPQLKSRPNKVYYDLLQSNGMIISDEFAGGKLAAGEYILPGDISSQYISGLLMALPNLDRGSEIILTTPLQSEPYIEMTLEVMRHFGVEIIKKDNGFEIPGNQKYVAKDYEAEGDWSAAAYFICAKKEVEGLNFNSLQGDRAIMTLLDKSGIDASDIPDLVPVLAAYALTKSGKTKIYNAARLKYKETNRLETLCKALGAIGGDIKETDDALLITGKSSLKGGEADSFGDHRIAMALALASLKCERAVTILNSDCVSKSYPSFFEDFEGNCILK